MRTSLSSVRMEKGRILELQDGTFQMRSVLSSIWSSNRAIQYTSSVLGCACRLPRICGGFPNANPSANEVQASEMWRTSVAQTWWVLPSVAHASAHLGNATVVIAWGQITCPQAESHNR